MEISKLLTKTISLTLDGIFKASDADIRVHGVENIPEQPVLFVINHFTRMETVIVPYVLNKFAGLYPISLAHYSFFSGAMGNIMPKLGAISTKDPDRDKIFIKTLLTGEMPAVIFPEGQMLKDKKIIEKGRYMVYNAGIRRPPHTGSARLALLSQFYRNKIQYFFEKGYSDEMTAYINYFGFEQKDIKKIISLHTAIVPVNITYYPIRAKENAINRFAEKFMGTLSDRYEEELEVEGTMLLEGVDIDINFGKAIYADNFLLKYSKSEKITHNQKLYIDINELKCDLSLRKANLKLMREYMDGIYGLTTLNHDHVFSYFLTMTPKEKISECALKNKAFLAIEKIKEKNLANIHTSMNKNQFHLLTDDEHDKYNSFIQAAIDDNVVSIKDGIIYKNMDRFNHVYQFHSVRKDNIVAVMKNEVEPLKEVIRELHKVLISPVKRDKKIIASMFLTIDRNLFDKDYRKYYKAEETKPRRIGEPFFLKHLLKNKKGVILIHGYMAAPEEIRVVADHLYDKGYTVYGVRLRGHGTSPEDLAKREWIEWYNSVNRAYIIMENTATELAIIGFSTGAGLALLHAANKGQQFKGLISINAPLKLQNIASRLSSAVVLWNKFLKKFNVKKGSMEFITNTPENRHINYFRNPVHGVRELEKLMNAVEEKLQDIAIPALIVQGSHDPVVNPESGLEIFEKLGSTDKELYRVFSERHGIVRGPESLKVMTTVDRFLEYIFTGK